jgi:hypothetical protein
MPFVVRAFPVLADREEDLREFARQMAGERATEGAEFYRQFGVAHESWHLQQTDAGPLVIAVTEVAEVDETAKAYATSQRPFDRWFKDQVKYLTGISPDRDPLGPPTEQIFEFNRRG